MDWKGVDIDRMGLHDLLTFWAKERPEMDVLIYEGLNLFKGRVERYTYRQMDLLSNRFANALIKMGIQKGDRVALYLPNCPEFIIAYFGIFKAGAAVVPVSPIYTAREITYQFNDTHARAVVTVSLLAANVDRSQLRQLEHVILLDAPEGTLSFKGMLEEASEDRPQVAVDIKNDIVMIPYTSGTTGIPKGVPHTHYHYTWNLREACRHMDFEAREVCCTITPLFHVTGYHDTFGLGLFCGWPTVVMERFDPVQFLQLVDRYKISFTLIPTAGLIYMLHVPEMEKYDISSLKGIMSGGAAVPQEIGQAVSKMYGVDLVEGYGSTEVLITHVNPRSRHGKIKYGSVGVNVNRNTTDIVTRIVDEDDGVTDRKQGDVGEIIVKIPCSSNAYLNKPEDSQENFRDGFWYSGDIGYIDDEGYLFITDRKKDMINVSGFKCWPREVEEVIHTHPDVVDVTVMGKPDPAKGEVPVAFVAPRAGVTLEAEALKSFLQDKLAKYKIPVQYIFMENLPKTLQGKPDRAKLKTQLD